jgi:hypothetical protein
MRFLESWAVLPPLDLLRWSIPVAGVLLLVLLPGRRAAGVASGIVALGVLVAPDLLPSLWLQLAWVALWVGLGLHVSRSPVPAAGRVGFLESGSIGALVGSALLVLVLAIVARQGLPHDETRRASIGIAVLALGLLHLMMRRHAIRASLAFAAMGFGLQILEVAAWGTLLPASPVPTASSWLATVIAVALAIRVGRIRQHVAGSPWVADAHDLHD